MFDIDEQVKHLEKKGIVFKLITKEKAKFYLENNISFYRVNAFKSNFEKENNRYKAVDFIELIDFADIDFKLRDVLIHLTLDIEYYSKIRLLDYLQEKGSNGFDIVEDFVKLQDKSILKVLSREDKNLYCSWIVKKHKMSNDRVIPVWKFIEILTLGKLLEFYYFCSQYYDSDELLYEYKLLNDIKQIRNASAHNNIILFDIRDRSSTIGIDKELMADCIRLEDKKFQYHIKNEIIRQIVTLILVHKKFVKSNFYREKRNAEILELGERIKKNIHYYSDDEIIKNTFDFLSEFIEKVCN